MSAQPRHRPLVRPRTPRSRAPANISAAIARTASLTASERGAESRPLLKGQLQKLIREARERKGDQKVAPTRS